MADRKGRRGAQKGRATKAADGTKPAEIYGKKLVIYKKLKELLNPVMDNYGEAALEELVTRLESTVTDFNAEVSSLFTEMVGQSKEDHAHLKSLLTHDEDAEDETELDTGAVEGMSDIERRLESIESETIETDTDTEE